MSNSFFIYLDRLVLLGFFSGYLLVYLAVHSIANNSRLKRAVTFNLSSLLPQAYALVGILYLGFLLKSLYPDYGIEHISSVFQAPALKIWGLLSILFFIPALSKRPVFSLLHSLVFFFFIVKDLFYFFFYSTGRDLVQNDMNIYTNSLLLNAVSFVFVLLVHFVLHRRRKPKI